MATNREICEAFARGFDPPLNIAPTHNVDGRPVTDAWICADKRAAVTAIAVNGALALYFDKPDAAELGRLVAGLSRGT